MLYLWYETIFLDTLYKYFHSVDDWFTKRKLKEHVVLNYTLKYITFRIHIIY